MTYQSLAVGILSIFQRIVACSVHWQETMISWRLLVSLIFSLSMCGSVHSHSNFNFVDNSGERCIEVYPM